MSSVAELVCHSCRAVSYSRVPRFRPDTMPACACGGRRQIVRVMRERRNEHVQVPFERRTAAEP